MGGDCVEVVIFYYFCSLKEREQFGGYLAASFKKE